MTCTFCAIPSFKGLQRSKAPADIIAEIRQLVDGGVREVILVSQNTTAYGYHGSNRLTTIIDRHNLTTTLAYDPSTGRLTSVTDPAGRVTQLTVDRSNRLTAINGPLTDVHGGLSGPRRAS